MEVWELVFYDSDADDRRGRYESKGLFHHKENAQARADRNNLAIIEAHNSDLKRRYEGLRMGVIEHNALVEAGLRADKKDLPEPPILINSRPIWPGTKMTTAHEYGDWWSVQPFDFEWEDEE